MEQAFSVCEEGQKAPSMTFEVAVPKNLTQFPVPQSSWPERDGYAQRHRDGYSMVCISIVRIRLHLMQSLSLTGH